jgi:hypothetical protein
MASRENNRTATPEILDCAEVLYLAILSTYLLTYLRTFFLSFFLTSWSVVLLEELTSFAKRER